jgi:hypothetical protein
VAVNGRTVKVGQHTIRAEHSANLLALCALGNESRSSLRSLFQGCIGRPPHAKSLIANVWCAIASEKSQCQKGNADCVAHDARCRRTSNGPHIGRVITRHGMSMFLR